MKVDGSSYQSKASQVEVWKQIFRYSPQGWHLCCSLEWGAFREQMYSRDHNLYEEQLCWLYSVGFKVLLKVFSLLNLLLYISAVTFWLCYYDNQLLNSEKYDLMMSSFRAKIASIVQEKSTQRRRKAILVFRCIILKCSLFFKILHCLQVTNLTMKTEKID